MTRVHHMHSVCHVTLDDDNAKPLLTFEYDGILTSEINFQKRNPRAEPFIVLIADPCHIRTLCDNIGLDYCKPRNRCPIQLTFYNHGDKAHAFRHAEHIRDNVKKRAALVKQLMRLKRISHEDASDQAALEMPITLVTGKIRR